MKRKKKWNCKKHCKKYKHCIELQKCIVAKELKRLEHPRRKGHIEIVFESEMAGTSHERFENCVWGTRKEDGGG